VVLVALCVGVTLAPCYHVFTSVLWWIIGAGSFFALYLLPTWQAFAGLELSLITCVNSSYCLTNA